MIHIHPLYDFDNCVWYSDNEQFPVEAKSLAALRKLLPKQTAIEGYYPDGYTVSFITLAKAQMSPPRDMLLHRPTQVQQQRRSKAHSDKRVQRATPTPVLRVKEASACPVIRGPAPTVDREKLLDLWFEGVMTYNQIAKAVGSKSGEYVREIVQRYRDKGDPRAVKRPYGGIQNKPEPGPATVAATNTKPDPAADPLAAIQHRSTEIAKRQKAIHQKQTELVQEFNILAKEDRAEPLLVPPRPIVKKKKSVRRKGFGRDAEIYKWYNANGENRRATATHFQCTLNTVHGAIFRARNREKHLAHLESIAGRENDNSSN